jgi:LPS O-antigen subunit length determinant protein (WzzB/FepE family)
MQNTQPPAQPYDDEIDLRQLVGTLWRQKGLIIGIAAVGAALGAGASLMSTKYVSDGLFLTPGVSAGNYKRFVNVFSSGPRLQQYLQSTNQASTAEGELLHALADNPNGLSEALKPEFAFTEKDQKTFGVKVTENDEPGAMIGVRIEFKHKEPTNGAPVTLLAEYVRDTVIRVNFESSMLARCADFRTREQELRNAQLSNDFAITQEERRVATLRDIIARNPEAAISDNRQIVSLEKGSERFLSPAAQLVAAEIQIADMKLAEIRRERERIASALKRDYYCQAQQALQQPTTGRAFLEELKNIQTTVFKSQDKSIDIIEQTWNELDVERENWANTYLQSMRFVASPEGTEVKQRKPGLALGVVLGGMLGGMFGVMLAFIRAWWRNNRDEITATPEA